MSGLNKLVFVAMIAAGFYAALDQFSLTTSSLAPIYQTPYVILYGRDSCGICQGVRQGLGEQSVPYVWKIVDDPKVQEELYPRMKEAGLDSGSFMLPVVDVSAEMLISPSAAEIIAKYKTAPPQKAVNRVDSQSNAGAGF